MSLEDDLRNIRTRISTAVGKKARAEAEYASAKERVDLAQADLETYGVTTVAEAKAKMAELTETLEAEKASIEAALTKAGA